MLAKKLFTNNQFFEDLLISGLKAHPLLKLSLLNILLNFKNSHQPNNYST